MNKNHNRRDIWFFRFSLFFAQQFVPKKWRKEWLVENVISAGIREDINKYDRLYENWADWFVDQLDRSRFLSIVCEPVRDLMMSKELE